MSMPLLNDTCALLLLAFCTFGAFPRRFFSFATRREHRMVKLGRKSAAVEKIGHMRWNTGLHFDRRLVLRHWNCDGARQQVQRIAPRPIDRIAMNGEIQRRAMDAQLMGASGQRRKLQPCDGLSGGVMARPP